MLFSFLKNFTLESFISSYKIVLYSAVSIRFVFCALFYAWSMKSEEKEKEEREKGKRRRNKPAMPPAIRLCKNGCFFCAAILLLFMWSFMQWSSCLCPCPSFRPSSCWWCGWCARGLIARRNLYSVRTWAEKNEGAKVPLFQFLLHSNCQLWLRSDCDNVQQGNEPIMFV